MSSSTSFVQLSADVASLAALGGRSTCAVRSGRGVVTGTVVGPGRVVTADHGVEPGADRVEVLAADGIHEARIAGRDAASDLALLISDGVNMPLLPRTTALPPVGSLVLSLGRTGDDVSAALGVVHSIVAPLQRRTGARLDSIIRTTIVPFPGYSGGPVLDAEGRLAGIATAGLKRGAALVVPIAVADRVMGSLAAHGRVRRGYVGVTTLPVELSASQQGSGGERRGLLVTSLAGEGPAARAGALIGDVIVSLDGQPVEDTGDLMGLLTGDLVGKSVPMGIVRGAASMALTLTVGDRGRIPAA
jgi:S1-C subfamily serine protease